jgi:hypothetical protein
VRDRLLRDGFIVLAVAFVGLRLFSIAPWADSVDAYAYWSTRDGSMYGGPIGAEGAGRIGAYLYSPAFAQLLTPLVALPWPIFDALWTAMNCALLWWLLGRAALPSLLFLPIPFEIISGNVHLLIAAAIVAGFRFAGTWALPILTKGTPIIGLAWFALRRDWRSLAVAIGVTGVIVAVSYLLDAANWQAWIGILQRDAGAGQLETTGWYLPVPLAIRAVVAAAIIVWGSVTNRAWTTPIAVTLALPILWLNGLAVLAACVPLARDGVAVRRSAS